MHSIDTKKNVFNSFLMFFYFVLFITILIFSYAMTMLEVGFKNFSLYISFLAINPRHACAARVTVVVLCVCGRCVCVCLCVCLFVVFCHHAHIDPKI